MSAIADPTTEDLTVSDPPSDSRLTWRRFAAGAEFRLLVQVAHLVGWQVASRGLGFIGAVWAARCLGPEKLGQSGIVILGIGQLAFLVNLNQDNLLVRAYKQLGDAAARESLVNAAMSFRVLISAACFVAALVGIWAADLSPAWQFTCYAGLPMILIQINQPLWLMQAVGKVSLNYKLAAVSSIVALGLCFLFLRPGAAAGTEVVIQGLAQGIALLWGWKLVTDLSSIRIHFAPAKEFLRRVADEGKWLAMIGVANYLYTAMTLPLLGYLGSFKDVGLMRSALSVTGVCTQINAVLFVLIYPKFIDWYRADVRSYWNRQRGVAAFFFTLLSPLAVGLFYLLPFVYPKVYGEEFAAAAIPCAWLVAAKCIATVNNMFTLGLLAQGKDRQVSLLVIATAPAGLAGNLLAIPAYGLMGCALVDFAREVVVLMAAYWMCRQANREAITTNDDAPEFDGASDERMPGDLADFK